VRHFVGMPHERVKALSKDPREQELILKGIQFAIDIATEHEDALGRVSQHEAPDAVSILKAELIDAMFRG
jgi:hypothetical protein